MIADNERCREKLQTKNNNKKNILKKKKKRKANKRRLSGGPLLWQINTIIKISFCVLTIFEALDALDDSIDIDTTLTDRCVVF